MIQHKRKFLQMKYLKVVFLLVLNIFAAVILGTGLLCCVYSLPVKQIDKHVEKSAATIQNEGTYPCLSVFFTSQLDNWTDSIMLLEAANLSEDPVLVKAMNVSRGTIDGNDPTKTLISHYIQGKEYNASLNYYRYWHGYLVFLKPLLVFTDYHSIRIINGICQTLMVMISGVLLKKRGKRNYILPWFLTYAMLMPVALAKCFEFSPCFYVLTGFTILLLLFNDVRIKWRTLFIFLNIGIATAYFDFLTYPIATFGIPMVFLMIFTGNNIWYQRVIDMFKAGAFWCIGYAGIWVSKWMLASHITGENVLSDAFQAFEIRTSNMSLDGLEYFGTFSCEIMNYKAFLRTPVTILVAALIAYYCIKMLCRKQIGYRTVLQKFAPYCLISVAPIVWYAFATNHSTHHFWFTNKACSVTVLAIMFGMTELNENNAEVANTYYEIGHNVRYHLSKNKRKMA